MTDVANPTDPDHELVDRLLTLHPPASPEVIDAMDTVRGSFIELGHVIVNNVPRTPDRTVALRSLHRACMDTITAITYNQPSS